jgi:hypothetical protein
MLEMVPERSELTDLEPNARRETQELAGRG